MKTVIHVNKHRIASNNKSGKNDPAITVKNYKKNQYAKRVRVTGTIEIIQSDLECGIKPLNCGAKVWIQVDDPKTKIEVIH